MDIDKFIAENDVDKSSALINAILLEQAEKEIGVSFGKELTAYLCKYGYLGYRNVELYGINSRQRLDSDMIRQSLYLHKYFPLTKNFVALENQGEGDYFLINDSDEVYEYLSEENRLINTGKKLHEYIFQRFHEALNAIP